MQSFDDTLAIINSPNFQDIQKWESINLKDYNEIDRNTSGCYVLEDSKYGVIYVGKGKSIFNRLKSHYNATQFCEKEKAESWSQFFECFKDLDLKAYWFPITHSNPFVAEQRRQALERLIQIKYMPVFDKIFPPFKRKRVENIQASLDKLL